jgi:hypothetical protein
MVHSGYEASAVDDTFASVGGLWRAAKATLFGGVYANREALAAMDQPDEAAPHDALVQLNVRSAGDAKRETANV